MYGENVIALLQEEKWKIVRTRERIAQERTMREFRKEGIHRGRTANVQQQMVARGGMGRDRSKSVGTETGIGEERKKRKRNQKRKKTRAVTDERERATAEPSVHSYIIHCCNTVEKVSLSGDPGDSARTRPRGPGSSSCIHDRVRLDVRRL